MNALLIALQLLTRFPLPFAADYADRDLGRSPLYYPLVGLIIGTLLLALAWLLRNAPSALSAALLLTVWAWLTGGLHLDGLADCSDAWVGGHGDRERSLRIMKDPAAGPIAVIALLLVLLVKWSALDVLMRKQDWLPLLMIPVLGRAAILVLMAGMPYVSAQGLAANLMKNLSLPAARIVLAATAWLMLMTLGWPCLLAAGLMLLAIRQLAMRRLGGATGDVYGAAVELCEAAALVTVAL